MLKSAEKRIVKLKGFTGSRRLLYIRPFVPQLRCKTRKTDQLLFCRFKCITVDDACNRVCGYLKRFSFSRCYKEETSCCHSGQNHSCFRFHTRIYPPTDTPFPSCRFLALTGHQGIFSQDIHRLLWEYRQSSLLCR